MNILITPNLDGLASDRLRAFAAHLAALGSARPGICEATNAEAALRLLADLRSLEWNVRADKDNFRRDVADTADAGMPLALQETELSDSADPPVSTDLLEPQGKATRKNSPKTLARRLWLTTQQVFNLARWVVKGRFGAGLFTHAERFPSALVFCDTPSVGT